MYNYGKCEICDTALEEKIIQKMRGQIFEIDGNFLAGINPAATFKLAVRL